MSASNGRRLAPEARERLLALLAQGMGPLAAARIVGCAQATAWWWSHRRDEPVQRKRNAHKRNVYREKHPGVARICIRADCEALVGRGENLCDAHRNVKLPVGGSDFIRALTPAELMRGRA